MMGGESVEDIDAALAEAFGSAPEAVEMVAPAVRRAKDKRMRLSPDDGRRKRRTGGTAQFNVKMRADLKARIVRFRPIGTVEPDLETLPASTLIDPPKPSAVADRSAASCWRA